MSKFKNFIIVYLHGGLGNQLYQFAFGRALSKKLNCDLKIDKSYYSQKNNEFPETFRLDNFKIHNDIKFISGSFKFKIQKLNYINRLFGNKFSLKFLLNIFFNKKIDNIFIENFLDVDLNILKNSKVNSAYYGYWEHVDFFDEIKDDIFANLDQKNINIEKIENFKKRYLKKNSLGIHLSDTRPWPNLYKELDDKYYIDGIKYFENLDEIDNIHIVAKDKQYALDRFNNLNIKYKLIYLSDFNFSTMEEFYLLRNYNNIIVSRSTFGWWASYLSFSKNLNIILPKKWWVKNKNNNINEGRITKFTKAI